MAAVKSGYMQKHSKSMLSGGWKQVFVVLHRDSTFTVYKKQGDSSPMGTIKMFDVRKWFAYGQYTDGMPDRPKMPAGASVAQVLAIPEKPSSKAKILWFLCSSEQDLHSWMDAICQVLPPPTASGQRPSNEQHAAPIQPQTASSVSAPPPYPGGPTPGPPIGFGGISQPGPSGYPPQPYPQQPYPQQPYPQQPYPQQPYPQQPAYPHQPPPPQPYYQPPAAYPQQPPHAAYPQQQYYPQGYYPQQQPGYAPAPAYPQQPGVVYVQNQPHKSKSGGFLSSNTGKMAAGLAGGALLGYGASRMMGGGFGLGRWGSWSSMSSFGSCGSFGSFGSFG